MANYAFWYFVLVIVLVQQVIARDCNAKEQINNCNECIQCNGLWCREPNENGEHCLNPGDNVCSSHKEELLKIRTKRNETAGHMYLEKTLHVGDSLESIELKFPDGSFKPEVIGSSVGKITEEHVISEIKRNCYRGKCTSFLDVKLTDKFCPDNGSNKEYFKIVAKLENDTEVFTGTYHVPCACECSYKESELKSEKCNFHGDFTGCGTCLCYDEWTGTDCKHKKKDQNERIDTGLCKSLINEKVCSDNGKCVNGKCQCFDGVITYGDHCDDACTYMEYYCDMCVLHPNLGKCDACNVVFLENTTTTDTTWKQCELSVNECHVQYKLTVDEANRIHAVVTKRKHCEGVSAPETYEPVNVAVPVVLGIIAAVASMAAVAAYAFLKNRPPVPLTGAPYGPIGAEGSTGINPLYKPPTSSFKNPAYGNKW